MSDSGEKQYQPTQRKLEEAKKKGNVARTRELGPALAFLAVASVAAASEASTWTQPFRSLDRYALDVSTTDYGVSEVWKMFSAAFIAWAPAGLLLLGAAATGSAASVVLQGGIVIKSDGLKLDPTKFDPAKKIKNLFSLQHLWDSLRAFASAGITLWVMWSAFRDELPHLVGLSLLPPVGVGQRLGQILIGVTWRAGLGLVILALLDFFINKQLYRQKMKMTRKELRDESKEGEASPEVKGRRRKRQLEIMRGGSLAAVQDADVVITNPTHFAVALSYTRNMMAPVVVAKGRNRTALRIRREALAHSVPIVHNPPLARELFAKVAVEQPIPPELFESVAEVIAFVMSLQATLGEPADSQPSGPEAAP